MGNFGLNSHVIVRVTRPSFAYLYNIPYKRPSVAYREYMSSINFHLQVVTAANTRTMAQVVYTRASDTDDVRGTLFEGKKFWLAQKIPQRSLFVEQVRVCGCLRLL